MEGTALANRDWNQFCTKHHLLSNIVSFVLSLIASLERVGCLEV